MPRLLPASILLSVLLALTLVSVQAQAPATPTASPAASPVADDDCTGLEAYFLALADLVRDDPALLTLRSVGFDALALSEADANAVVADLNRLIPVVEVMHVPAAARSYHTAYVAMLTWYRDLAAHRDAASHQRLINNDRHLFGDLGLGVMQGQLACGVARWNGAYEAAFPTTR